MCVPHESFFFFKQKTAYEMRISDWSSDVCSSDRRATKPEPPNQSHQKGEPESMAIERTFSIIKPDATRRNITGKIIDRLEQAGLRVIASKRDRKRVV